MNESMLKIENLFISAINKTESVTLVNNINMEVKENSICCIVGNSGSGKSLLATTILGIIENNLQTNGKIYFKGEDILQLKEKRLREIRGRQIGIVMQNCTGSLNPLLKNGKQLHLVMKNRYKGNAKERAQEVLRQVELQNHEEIVNQYPHELSGGMKQRLMTAIGMIYSPNLLIMDEPTKGLDVILRNQMATMIDALHTQTKTTILLITHDLELANKLSDYCYVMNKGEIVAEGNTKELFNNTTNNAFFDLLSAERKISSFFTEEKIYAGV